MPRYIDADKLMEQLNKKKPETGKARYVDGFNDAIMRVRSMVYSASVAVDVIPKNQWISVNDRLPTECSRRYLVLRKLSFKDTDDFITDFGYYESDGSWTSFDPEWGDYPLNNVVYWMPIPEPPKMKGD